MKSLSLLLLATTALVACKKDNGEPNEVPVPEPAGYTTGLFAPISPGSWWTYDQFNISPGGVETPGAWHDSVYVVADTLIGSDTYHRWRGTRFNQPFRWLFRFDGPRLVDQNGGLYMDVTATSDTLDVSSGTWPVDSVAFVLTSAPIAINAPAGALTSEHGREYVHYMAAGFPSPQVTGDRFVCGIGLGLYIEHYAAGTRAEMRLDDYHIAE